MFMADEQKSRTNIHEWLLRVEYPVVAFLAFVVLGIMAFFTFNLSFLSPVKKAISEFSMTDLYYQILHETGTPPESPLITIVDMTELISRRDLAEALEAIEACNPALVGVDMVFEGRKEDVVGDSMIASVAAQYANIIWSKKLRDFANDSLEYTDAARSFFADSLQIHEGVTNMSRQLYGGVKRKIDQAWIQNGEIEPSFIVETTNAYAGKEVAETKVKSVEINFTPTLFRVIPADSIVYYPDLIADRIVLFGAMNEEVDMHYTPLGKIPGIMLLAYGVQTLLKQNQIIDISGILFWVISFLIVTLTYWGRKRRREWVAGRKNATVRLLLGFPLVSSVISFAWMALLLYFSFVLFCGYDISFNLGLAFSAIAFLLTAENTFTAITNYTKEIGS